MKLCSVQLKKKKKKNHLKFELVTIDQKYKNLMCVFSFFVSCNIVCLKCLTLKLQIKGKIVLGPIGIY